MCLVPLETTLGCTEVVLNDNLAPLSIKGTRAEIFRLPNFANTIWGGGLLASFKGCGVFTPFWGWVWQ